MKDILKIIGIGLVVAFVLHGVERKQVNGEALREMERIGLELNNIADHLEKRVT